ncbi:hypothetical protein BBJ28_00001198 [Nothophytophthora sp. Chile5]|nr:hypothetical protein BBJ28_00001198 [Nothophytophthora sp. Chile5]
MAGDLEESAALAAEVVELQSLLAQAKAPGNQKDLKELLQRKQRVLDARTATAEPQQEEPMEVDEAATAEPLKAEPAEVKAHQPKASPAVDDITSFTEISRFGWEDDGVCYIAAVCVMASYGKEKVSVYIMSGIDGVGALPKENVTCTFTKTSFDLKKNINPAKSSFRVKKNRVTISLFKADKSDSWMNLTAKNPLKTAKPDTSDPTAGIMDMMKVRSTAQLVSSPLWIGHSPFYRCTESFSLSTVHQNMYDDGDEDMKRTIAKAWSESREKTAAGGGL